MKKAPKIRFDGYTGDWEQRKLSELLSFSNGFNGSKDMYGEGIPYISVMDILNNDVITYDIIQGKVNLDERVAQRYIVEYGDILFQRSSENIEDAGRSNVYVDTERTAVFGGFVIRGKKVSEYDPIFMKKNLETRQVRNQITSRAQGAQHINVGQETLGSVKVYFPLLNEQKIIGNFFQTLDSFITLHQKECEKMLDFKEYMLKKMFPREGFSVPEIRFNGFDGAWSKCRFGELVVKFEDPVETPTGGYMRLGIKSHAKGTFHSYVKEGEGLETAKMFRVAPNKFIVNITFGWEHAVAITDEHDADKLVSHRFPQYSFKEGMRPDFFKWIILDKRFKYHLGVSSPGGAGRNRVLNLESMLEYEMFVPSVKEQQAIGQYFRELDELILLHQREVETYKKMKQYMLRNMFV